MPLFQEGLHRSGIAPAVDHCTEHTAHVKALRAQSAADEALAAGRDAEAADRDEEQAEARWHDPRWTGVDWDEGGCGRDDDNTSSGNDPPSL
ncbi:MAG: hypothetical protein ABIM89_00890 [Mycobacteriales bacterium]